MLDCKSGVIRMGYEISQDVSSKIQSNTALGE
jgi:hypothetical protein